MEVVSSSDGEEGELRKEFVSDFYGERYKKGEEELDSFDSIMKKFTMGSEKYIQDLYDRVHPDVSAKDYGCGCPIPPQLKGKRVLDLGSGSGRDCFVLSHLVGAEGAVIGIDCGDEALELSTSFKDHHRKEFGLSKDNVTFLKGDIQDLRASGIETGSVDVVVSNCVINLAEDKSKVYEEVFRVLKDGGEFYISDIYSSIPLPSSMKNNEFLMSICASGAIHIPDYVRTMERIGFRQKHIKVMEFKPLARLEDPVEILEVLKIMDPSLTKPMEKMEEVSKSLRVIDQMEEKVKLYSITTRIIKTDDEEEERKKNNNNVFAMFLGHEHNMKYFDLDVYTRFEAGVTRKVDWETYKILKSSRYNFSFKFEEEEDEEIQTIIKNMNFEDTVDKIEEENERRNEGTPFFNNFLDEIKISTHQRLAISSLLFALLYFLMSGSTNYNISLVLLSVLLAEYTSRLVFFEQRTSLFFWGWKFALPALPILFDRKRKLENYFVGFVLLLLFVLNMILFWEDGSGMVKFGHEVISFLLVVLFGVEAVLKKSISNNLL